jgi:hypothetical protein
MKDRAGSVALFWSGSPHWAHCSTVQQTIVGDHKPKIAYWRLHKMLRIFARINLMSPDKRTGSNENLTQWRTKSRQDSPGTQKINVSMWLPFNIVESLPFLFWSLNILCRQAFSLNNYQIITPSRRAVCQGKYLRTDLYTVQYVYQWGGGQRGET